MPSLPRYEESSLSEIDETYNRLQARFATHVTRSVHYRTYNLKQLAYMIKDNTGLIEQALKEDLGKGAFDASLSDIWVILNEIDLAIKRLPQWMRDEDRSGDAVWSFRTVSAKVKKQPRGVCLIISPWNYPWNLNLSPLVGAIAAGCPVILKPSELAPVSSALLAELLPKYLDPEAYAVINGAVEHTTKLMELQWGHVLYTGSGNVGKIIAGAAAKTLSPSTLELGGKSPVIVSSCANLQISARRMLSIKQLNAGQMCVCPDYVLCSEDVVDAFIKECRVVLDEFFPHSPNPHSFLKNEVTADIHTDRDFQRHTESLDQAEKEGNLLYRAEADSTTRRMGISLVKQQETSTGSLVENEIFGPVLPIIAVKDIDRAIQYINARPKPLALYVLSSKKAVFDRVIQETTSGSATWNDFGFATLARQLPFGGVGDSGWGSYHGRDGFNTFSHSKAVLEIPYYLEVLQKLRYPQIKSWVPGFYRFLLLTDVSYARPVSVESEKKLYQRKKLKKRVTTVLTLVAIVYGLQKGWGTDRLTVLLEAVGRFFYSLSDRLVRA